MQWFQTESNAPNDPKIKAMLREGGQSAAGAVFLLWCYIAREGKAEPGLGVRADGTGLALSELTSELLFDTTQDALVFLNRLAELHHIHPQLWTERQVVFLPAMFERAANFARSRGRPFNYDTVAAVVQRVLHPDTAPVPQPGNTGAQRGTSGHKRPKRGRVAPTEQTKQTSQTGQTDQGGGPSGQSTPVDALVKLWNDERRPGPKIESVTPARAKAYRAALKRHPNLTTWQRVIRWVNKQSWCNAPGTGDHPTWRADLDWLSRSGKMEKALERMQLDRTPTDGPIGRDASKGRTGAVPGEFAKALKDQ